jgi:hypothetical protein
LLIIIVVHDIPFKTEFEVKPKILFESINLMWVGAEEAVSKSGTIFGVEIGFIFSTSSTLE